MEDFGNNPARVLFPKGPTLTVKAVALVAVSLSLMFADHQRETLSPLRSALAVVIQPVSVLAQVPNAIKSIGTHFVARETLIDENRILRENQLRLNGELQKLSALRAENARIRDLLQSSRLIEDKVLIAEIVSSSLDPYRNHIRLNRGTLDGIYKGQALVDAHGIMGQIVDVTLFDASAVLITDANHGIPVEINRNGLQTIAQGAGEGAELILPYLPGNADVREGDLLVSSGLGGRYPAGYPVGRVTGIRHQPGEHFLEVFATPTAKLNHGREVLLVWDNNGDDLPPVPARSIASSEETPSAGQP